MGNNWEQDRCAIGVPSADCDSHSRGQACFSRSGIPAPEIHAQTFFTCIRCHAAVFSKRGDVMAARPSRFCSAMFIRVDYSLKAKLMEAQHVQRRPSLADMARVILESYFDNGPGRQQQGGAGDAAA
jgi:hypothetical protein